MSFPDPNDPRRAEERRDDIKPGRRVAAMRRLPADPRARCRKDQEREREPREPLVHHVPRASAMPATRPAMLNCFASTVGRKPNSRSVAVVMGPMLASFTLASFDL